MAEVEQAVIGWGPTSNGLAVLACSSGWPHEEGRPWLPAPLATFLPRGADTEVMRGTEPPVGLEARPTPYGTLLSAKVYLGRIARPGTFTAHALLDPGARQSAIELIEDARSGVLRTREEQPDPAALAPLRLPTRCHQPDPAGLPEDWLRLVIARLAAGRPLLLRSADRSEGTELLESLARALPKRVVAGMWWSTAVTHPDAAAGPGVGLVVPPFVDRSVPGADPAGSNGPADARVEIVDLATGAGDVPARARSLAATYADRPETFAGAGGVDDFVARVTALTIDPADPLDARGLDLLAGEMGPDVFARLITGGHGMKRLAELSGSGRRLPYGTLWAAVPDLPDSMYGWFGPVRSTPDAQERAQRVITATMDRRALVRLVARPLAHDVAEYRPVVADRRLASAVASLEVPLDGYEWRVLTEEWGPVVRAAVMRWLEGWTDAPADLARFAADRETFVAGLGDALAAVAAPSERVRERLAGWRGLDVADWVGVLLDCSNVPAGTALAALAGRDRTVVRQVLRRSWPRLAADAGVPAEVADELRVRGLGGW